MARDQRVRVRIEAEDRASDDLRRVESNVGKTESSLSRFKIAAAATVAAVTALVAAFVKLSKATFEQEKSIRTLEVALKPLGSAARGVRDDLLSQADSLATLTGRSDTAIVSVQALLAQMGVGAERLAQATQASVNLSAALGIDLQSAARNVGRTVGGFAGELGELIPELKDLDASALRAGEGIELLAEKFEGTAAAARTGAESLQELGNATQDFGRNLVSAVANSENFQTVIDFLAEAIRSITPEFQRQENVLSSWRDVVINSTDAVSVQVGAINDWLTSIGRAGEIDQFVRNLNTLRASGFSVAEAFEKLVTAMERAEQIEQRQTEQTKLLADALSGLGVNLSENLNQKLADLSDLQEQVEKGFRSGAISARDYEVATEAIAQKQADLRRELEGVAEVTGDAADAQDRLTESLRNSSDALDRETRALEVNSREQQRNLTLAQQGSSIRLSPSAAARLGTTGFQFEGGKFVFIDGRRAQVFPDGRVVFP